jgi:hypothetical protein
MADSDQVYIGSVPDQMIQYHRSQKWMRHLNQENLNLTTFDKYPAKDTFSNNKKWIRITHHGAPASDPSSNYRFIT